MISKDDDNALPIPPPKAPAPIPVSDVTPYAVMLNLTPCQQCNNTPQLGAHGVGHGELAVPQAEPIPCDCCGNSRDVDGVPVVLGTLAMPMRRKFLVCNECVVYLWNERHWANEVS